jgi:hypothetical protein
MLRQPVTPNPVVRDSRMTQEVRRVVNADRTLFAAGVVAMSWRSLGVRATKEATVRYFFGHELDTVDTGSLKAMQRNTARYKWWAVRARRRSASRSSGMVLVELRAMVWFAGQGWGRSPATAVV